VIGTDKGGDEEFGGGLYIFDLNGKIIPEKCVTGLARPNNVDVEYGLTLKGVLTDITVVTERGRNQLRVFSLPKMDSVDNGGIPVFEGEELRSPMGIALYKQPDTGKIYAIVSRKTGPTDGTYLWQYLLEDNGEGRVKGTLVRKFGKFEGGAEIESIAVDDALGYVYYSDEGFGVRKYYADPEKGNEELALFGRTGFTRDLEGISIYTINDGTGYILVSDQQANQFHIFTREGADGNPHDHQLIKTVKTATVESDGSEVTSASLNGTFVNGMFVAMSDDKTFQFYKWEDIAGSDLKVARNGKIRQ
jgi:3-phytase